MVLTPTDTTICSQQYPLDSGFNTYWYYNLLGVGEDYDVI